MPFMDTVKIANCRHQSGAGKTRAVCRIAKGAVTDRPVGDLNIVIKLLCHSAALYRRSAQNINL